MEEENTQNNMEYVDVIDLDGRIIQLNDEGLYYTDDDGKNYSIRIEFNEIFGDVETYLKVGYEATHIENFDIDKIKQDNYEGTFILKSILDDGCVLKQYYTYIGWEDEEDFKVAPIKIPELNVYTVDPTKVVSRYWYYVESNGDDAVYHTLEDYNSKNQ